MLFSDTEILLEEVPAGTRIVFPNPPIEGLANPAGGHPLRDQPPRRRDPLYAQLRRGCA